MRRHVIPLWIDGAPGSPSRRKEPEKAQDWWIKNIHNPSLTEFVPTRRKATGTAVIIAPGGGHRELVFDAEGVDPARYLAGSTNEQFKARFMRELAHCTPGTLDE